MSEPVPDTMSAIEITTAGAPEVLRPVHRPVPVVGDGEDGALGLVEDGVRVLVRVVGVGEIGRASCRERV